MGQWNSIVTKHYRLFAIASSYSLEFYNKTLLLKAWYTWVRDQAGVDQEASSILSTFKYNLQEKNTSEQWYAPMKLMNYNIWKDMPSSVLMTQTLICKVSTVSIWQLAQKSTIVNVCSALKGIQVNYTPLPPSSGMMVEEGPEIV